MAAIPTTGHDDTHARWLGLVVGLALVLVLAGVAWVVLAADPVPRPEGVAAAPTTPPASPLPVPSPSATPSPGVRPSPSATPSPQPRPDVVDCSQVPPPEAFTVGTEHPCFAAMGERLTIWLGGNTRPAGVDSPPSVTFTADQAVNIEHVQLIMGDSATGVLTQSQWSRLDHTGPPAITEIRATGIGPLWFGMTRAEIQASGVARMTYPGEDDPVPYPSVEIPGADVATCVWGEEFVGVLVKDSSNVSTLEGITTRSSDAELDAVFGDRLVLRDSIEWLDWVNFAVYSDEFGYGFMRQGDGPLVIVAGTRAFVDSTSGGPHGVCHV